MRRVGRVRAGSTPAVAVLLAGLPLLALLFVPAQGPARAGPAALANEPAGLREGFRRYQGVCGHCHGPDGSGSSFAPGLIGPLASRERFDRAVLEGVAGPRGVMRGFAGDRNVEPYLDAIYAYLAERASGRLGRGRGGRERRPAGTRTGAPLRLERSTAAPVFRRARAQLLPRTLSISARAWLARS